MLPEPGVSWINLPSQRYQGPAQRSRRLPFVQAESNTARGYPSCQSGTHASQDRTSTKADAPRSTCQFYGQPEHAQQTVKVPHHGAMARELSLVQARGAKNCIIRR